MSTLRSRNSGVSGAESFTCYHVVTFESDEHLVG